MDWEYKITKSNLWYNVFREKDEDWILRIEWLQIDTYTLCKNFARTFYHLQDAESALVIERIKWRKGKQTPTILTKKSESGKRREKISWSEL